MTAGLFIERPLPNAGKALAQADRMLDASEGRSALAKYRQAGDRGADTYVCCAETHLGAPCDYEIELLKRPTK
jgi:hypothetical protein